MKNELNSEKEAKANIVDGRKMRCKKCNALLFKVIGKFEIIEIKCRKCGYINDLID